MKLDILVIVAHPDDAELGAAGTILSHIQQGRKVGIVDLTQGELGTNGDVEIRKKEAFEAAKLLGVEVRENLNFADAFFTNDRNHQLEIIKIIRKYRPEILITNAPKDRHPDHRKASQLVTEAAFLSGLKKINDRTKQKEWRPKHIYYMVQSQYLQPDIVVDITDFWKKKIKSIQIYQSQFYVVSGSIKEETYISTPKFMKFIEARAREYGQAIGVEYGEGFIKKTQIGVKNLFDII